MIHLYITTSYIRLIITILLIVSIIYIYYRYRTETSEKGRIINNILRQSSRWAVASQQDLSPLIRLLHANYAAGYLWALRDTFTDSEIEEYSGIDIIEYRDKIISIQDSSTRAVTAKCPEFIGDGDESLFKIAGDK